jgi:hypothetical protein
MAITYTYIAKYELASAANVTFTSIPQTYNDLVVKFIGRTTYPTNTGTLRVRLNGNTSSVYSYISLHSETSTIDNNYGGGDAMQPTNSFAGDLANWSGYFEQGELYLPNYTNSSFAQPISLTLGAMARTTADNYNINQSVVGLYTPTDAITSIGFDVQFYQFVAGSAFYLYGIKNS